MSTAGNRWPSPIVVCTAVLLGAALAQPAEVPPVSPPPMACNHEGGGTLYDVGPDRPFGTIGEVPWEDLTAGDTVRIHWREEPYREKILIRGQGTAEQPITVCGVAGPGGELPIIDGEDATTRPSMGYTGLGTQARGLIHVGMGDADGWGYKPSHIVIQGLHIRGAFHEHSFSNSAGAVVGYTDNAAGIFVERGEDVTVRGVLLTGNGNGFFVASGDSEEVRSRAIVLERSALYGNGTVTTGFDRHHNIYTEADGMLFQFNYIGPLRAGSGGTALKDRSAGTVIRYNWIEGGSRSLDLVDAEESWRLATALPAYSDTFVYGNVLVNEPDGPTNMVHYGGDSGVTERYRKGTLHFFHNTVAIRSDQEGEGSRWRVVLFDVSTEDETVDARNNIVFIQPATPGARPSDLAWMRSGGVLELGVNWASPGITEFRDGVEISGRVSGMDNLLGDPANDPGFVDAPVLLLLPRADGPAVDQGQELHPTVLAMGHTVDFEYLHPASGRQRLPLGAPDLGAFELQEAGSAWRVAPAAAVSPEPATATPSTATPSTPTPSTAAPASTAAGPQAVAAVPSAGYPLAAGFMGAGPDGADNGERYPCSGAGAASPAVLCVRAGAAAGGDGSAGSPFASISAAVAAARPGDVIQVAAGSYRENVAVGDYNDLSDKHLKLLGGFDPADFGVRDAAVHHTVIDGGFQDPGVRLHVASDGTTVLDGFHITRGRGLGSSWEDGYGAGGGVYVHYMGHGEVVVSHNVVYDNETFDYTSFDLETRGGGIHSDFQDWEGDSRGNVRIENNIVSGNRASRGAGINVRGPRATIIGNLIEDNQSHGDHGGGLYISTASTIVERNVIRGNVIGATFGYGWGGGVFVGAASAELYGNVISHNFAPTIGSGIFWDEGATGTMRNDLIFANRCPDDARSGAAIYVDGGEAPSHVLVENATIADHHCPDSSGGVVYVENGSSITVRNSILWGNTHEFSDADATASHAISYSITAEPGQGNFLADPLFADPAAGDYHLRSSAGRYTAAGWVSDGETSPALDAGDPAADHSQEPQPNGGRLNLGAYGNTAEASKSP